MHWPICESIRGYLSRLGEFCSSHPHGYSFRQEWLLFVCLKRYLYEMTIYFSLFIIWQFQFIWGCLRGYALVFN